MNLPLLHYLDVLIGFSAAMLLGATVVASVTQVLVRALNLRAANLQAGLTALVSQLDPSLVAHAKVIARQVLKHPLIADLGLLVKKKGGVVQREELVRILFELASPNSALQGTPAHSALAAAIGRDPVATLRAIRERTQELERDAPWLASHVRQTQAILEKASGEFVGTITDWFDETMDRLSQRFALRTQVLSILAAFVVAGGLGLDSIALLRRLDADPVLRAQAVEQARQLADAGAQAVNQPKDPQAAAQAPADPSASLPASVPLLEAQPILFFAPRGPHETTSATSRYRLAVRWQALPGVLLSIVLLSLGSPFWFDLLKNSLRLRPVLSGKEEQERDERRLEQPPTASVPPAAADEGEDSEMGDLLATLVKG